MRHHPSPMCDTRVPEARGSSFLSFASTASWGYAIVRDITSVIVSYTNYFVATSMISAVPAKTHFAEGAFVFKGALKTYVGPRRRYL